MKLTVQFQDCWEDTFTVPESDRWLAWFVEMPGMVVSASTKQDAFNELMTSLRVKILYDNNRYTYDIR